MAGWVGHGWSIDVDPSRVRAVGPRTTFELSAAEAIACTLRRGLFGWKLERPGVRPKRLPGMRAPVVDQLKAAIARLWIDDELRAWVRRYDDLHAACERGLAEGRWVPWDVRMAFLIGRDEGLPERVNRAGALAMLSPREQQALVFGPREMAALVDETNRRILHGELRSRPDFFATIESRPLTEEQARAVVAFDNRVQVLAAAGSGKTSVMVARAAYAVARGFVRPERIVLLAFNTKAAEELQERVKTRFAAAGLSSEGVRASTFHSFGLSVIGAATGRKPSLAPWVADGRDAHKISEIVDRLRDSDTTFRYQWDLYRLVFARVPIDPGDGTPDTYDRERKETGYQTLNGTVVRSEGERMIADWLFVNGVEFEYERPYVFDVADATHRQYTPDFYYPAIDTWHEHWAVGRDGQPPAEFVGYADAMRWKRSIHQRYRTDLIETTFAEIVLGDGGFRELEKALVSRGVELDWNPDRPGATEPVTHDQMVRLVRTFLSHVKSSRASKESLQQLLGTTHSRLAGTRTRLFLDVFWPVFDAWNEELRAGGFVDFDDMLAAAAELVAAGHDPGCDLVLVDEFQDSSRARARLVQGLVAPGSRYLLAVGDDWQAINRFAGADLSVMTEFSTHFGPGPQLALTTTFRCSQVICDVSSEFVSRNRRQFAKAMRSVDRAEPGPPIEVVFAEEPGGAVEAYLERLSKQAGPAGASVFVLGRYRFEQRDAMPSVIPSNLRVGFHTVHGAKGAEADFVIVPGMNSGTHGFPSTIADDPVLDLVLGAPDTFEHAEERRLLYVALTRARRGVLLVASPTRPSPFVAELLESARSRADAGGGRRLVVEVDWHGEVVEGSAQARPCPQCKAGTLVSRTSAYGPFLACSRFPACTYKEDDRQVGGGESAGVGASAAVRAGARSSALSCPECGTGHLTRRNGRYGPFYGCTRYPACRFTVGM